MTMNIGKHNLNANESEWLTNYLEDLYRKSADEMKIALNKHISIEDASSAIKGFSGKKVESKVEPEVVDEEEDEVDDDIE